MIACAQTTGRARTISLPGSAGRRHVSVRAALVCAAGLICVTCLAWPASAAPPTSDSPRRLLDLRHLAREPANAPFRVDTWSQPPDDPPGEDGLFVLASVEGPGVAHHLMAADAGRWVIEVDGERIFDGSGEDWRHIALHASSQGPGERPWAWPLAMNTPNALHYALPIPFATRLRVLSDEPAARLWMAGERLEASPERRFNDAAWRAEMNEVYDFLGFIHEDNRKAPPVESWQGIYPMPGSETRVYEAAPGPDERVNLLELEGAGEIVGLRFEFHLPFFNRLRYLVVEITPDGAEAPTVRMPLMAILGDTHPFYRLWNLTHGTWVTGLQHPAPHEPWLTGWFRLPIPYQDGLRIDLVNRNPDLPQHVRAHVRVAPLEADDARRALRLAGTSRVVELPRADGEAADLLTFEQGGRLAMLTMFTTGHERLGGWTSNARVRLREGDVTTAAGFPLFPLARSPYHAKPINLTWSQPQYGTSPWHGGSRVFWLDPLALAESTRLQYVAGGEGGPKRAEVAALWYQRAPYAAPELPDAPPELPERRLDALPAEAPGGWMVEAEDWLDRARPHEGDVYIDRRLALDAQASGDAFLGWNAPAIGAAMDLMVVTPPTPYVDAWVRAPWVPGGGLFALRLVPSDRRDVAPLWDEGERDFAAHSRGYLPAPVLVRSSGDYPLQRLLHHQTRAALRNPAPGSLARLRFVATAVGGGRLALDQITLNPAPPPPPGWQTLHGADASAPAGSAVRPLVVGRRDFHGYGGLRLTAAGPAAIRVPLSVPVVLGGDRTITLRGRVQRGEWAVRPGGDGASGEGHVLGEPGETTDWSITFPDRAGEPVRELIFTTSAAGELLLNAWRLGPPDDEHEHD